MIDDFVRRADETNFPVDDVVVTEFGQALERAAGIEAITICRKTSS